MRIKKLRFEAVLAVPDSEPDPNTETIERMLAHGYDVISKQEFDTVDDYPIVEFLSIRHLPEG